MKRRKQQLGGVLDSLQNGANWLGDALGPGTAPGLYYPQANLPGYSQQQQAQDYTQNVQTLTDAPYNAVAGFGNKLLLFAGVGIIAITLLTRD